MDCARVNGHICSRSPNADGAPASHRRCSTRGEAQTLSFLVACMFFSSGVFAAPVAGDVDGNRWVNAVDVQHTVNTALGVDTGPLNADLDADGSVNAADMQIVINAVLGLDIDSDDDGLSDRAESNIGTEPDKADSDDDGLDDSAELAIGTDPTRSDSDDDGLKDGVEVNEYQTDPLHVDADGDRVDDGREIAASEDPAG